MGRVAAACAASSTSKCRRTGLCPKGTRTRIRCPPQGDAGISRPSPAKAGVSSFRGFAFLTAQRGGGGRQLKGGNRSRGGPMSRHHSDLAALWVHVAIGRANAQTPATAASFMGIARDQTERRKFRLKGIWGLQNSWSRYGRSIRIGKSRIKETPRNRPTATKVPLETTPTTSGID